MAVSLRLNEQIPKQTYKRKEDNIAALAGMACDTGVGGGNSLFPRTAVLVDVWALTS